jgi:membrane protein required for beta-lactamase induction
MADFAASNHLLFAAFARWLAMGSWLLVVGVIAVAVGEFLNRRQEGIR